MTYRGVCGDYTHIFFNLSEENGLLLGFMQLLNKKLTNIRLLSYWQHTDLFLSSFSPIVLWWKHQVFMCPFWISFSEIDDQVSFRSKVTTSCTFYCHLWSLVGKQTITKLWLLLYIWTIMFWLQILLRKPFNKGLYTTGENSLLFTDRFRNF